ncbi:MAG TPA: alpha/beta fold hydrolase [Candidatus Acidoferrales bacterium]|jgi:dipeptidyl aminopeptidase/acylaminoacyl peptidase|nr:alpha/beta fold hydrolase [Candidatus Acidoferrales bacterium]
MRRAGRIAGGSASALALAWAAGCAFVYRRAFGHRYIDPRMTTPDDYNAPHETLNVRTADGVRLAAWYLPGTLPAAIVVSGGYRGRAGDVLGVSTALQRAGFHVVAYGWRGTPGSDSAAHTLGVYEREDLRAVIDALAARLGDVPIGLLGYSMGGAVSISVAAEDPRIHAVCTDSAFADPRRLIGERVQMALRVPAAMLLTPVIALFARRTGTRLTDFMPVLVVGAIAPRPLLIIHGDDDSTVPLHHALMLYEAAKQPKELWRLPGVGHVGAYFADRRAYVERITTFFLEALVRGRARRAAG